MTRILRVSIFIILFFSFAQKSWGAVIVEGVRFNSTKEFTRIVLDLKDIASYRTFMLSSPLRLVIDINNAKFKARTKNILINDKIVKRVRAAQFNLKTVRVVIDLVKKADHHIFALKEFKNNRKRIVVDLSLPEIIVKERKNRNIIRDRKKGEYKVIVIDPGHGGVDPGAIGPHGTKEKDVVLKISKKLFHEINKKTGFRSYLTRSKDYFIPLRKRINIAMDYGADLFVSIHADASFDKKARGASVYCISLRAADREASRIISKNHNITNWIFEDKETHPKNLKKDVQKILFDLHQTQILNQSLILGGLTLKEFSKITHLRFKRPKQAGFVVLKSPRFPSILIETGFISNKTDSKLLKKDSFQAQLVKSITAAITHFFNSDFVVDTLARRKNL